MKSGQPEIITIEDRLRKMREGYKLELKIVAGGLDIPCRLLTATEEVQTIARARASINLPANYSGSVEAFTGVEIQKAVLETACTVDNVPYAPRAFLDKCTLSEIQEIYDQYVSVLRQVNPRFEKIAPEEVAEMILAVKKNQKEPSDYFTWQLAEIGKFFLEKILPKANEAGFW
mgnify:CR=1 FL=1